MWCCAILMLEAITESQTTLQHPLRYLSQFLLLSIFIHMVYTSPTKVAHIVEWNRWGCLHHKLPNPSGSIALLSPVFSNSLKKSGDYYVDLVEWAIASHGMYESALIFTSISKQKNLYIVDYVQCDNRIFPAARIKILPNNDFVIKIAVCPLHFPCFPTQYILCRYSILYLS
jgi:hypothetical protein